MSKDEPQPDSNATLYNPSDENAESFDPDDPEVELQIEISEDLANRLRDVALHLGLPPSILASRAIGMICNEIGIIDEEELSSDEMIQKYQTRLDILHTIKEHAEAENSPEEMSWDAVDEIIEQADQSKSDFDADD